MQKCSECGKEFSLFYMNARDYAYKTKGKNKHGKGELFYQCSYTCYKKSWEKHKGDYKRQNRGKY